MLLKGKYYRGGRIGRKQYPRDPEGMLANWGMDNSDSGRYYTPLVYL